MGYPSEMKPKRFEALTDSASDAGCRELYSTGFCHAFALALHRRLGWTLVLATDPDSPYWKDDEDPDNTIDGVVHVLAMDSNGEVWDIFGSRPRDSLRLELEDRFPDTGSIAIDDRCCEADLASYIDGRLGKGDDEIDRPLVSITDSDIDEAFAHALIAFEGMEGWPATTAPAP